MPQAPVQLRSTTGRLVSGVLVAMTLASLGFALRATSEPERVPYLHLARILLPVALLLLLVGTRFVSAERPRVQWALLLGASVLILFCGIRFWTAGRAP